MAVDEGKLMEFLGQFVGDLGATVSAGAVVLGDRLGLYRALAQGPATPGSWPSAPAPTSGTSRSGCADRPPAATSSYDAAPATYSLTEEQAFALADPDRPGVPAGRVPARARRAQGAEPGSTRRSAPAPAWAGTSTTPTCSSGCERFFRPGYVANLVPELDPRARRRRRRSSRPAPGWPTSAAGTVRRRSCSRRRTRNSTFVGSDYHEGSIEAARKQAADAGRGRPGELRGGLGAGLHRDRLRPRGDVRLPARHGRPGRRGAGTCASRSRRTAPG